MKSCFAAYLLKNPIAMAACFFSAYRQSTKQKKKQVIIIACGILFIMLYKVVLTFKSVDETLKCDLSDESY